MLLGAHCSGGVKRALDRAVEIGADAVQLFTQSPRTWRTPAPDPEVYAAFRERRAETGIGSVLCHALYLCNLAAPDDTVYDKSVATLSATVDIACAIEAEGVVFHVGSHLGAGLDAGLDRVEAAMRTVLDRCSDTTWLLMENSAGAGATIGRSMEELAILFERLDAHPRLGVCLDSCHLLASGYEIREPEALGAVVDEFDRQVGLDRLVALHLNDSMTALGSNRDRHAILGEGEIGEDGLRVFLGERRFRELPVLLETGPDGHGPDKRQVDIAKRLREEAGAPKRARASRMRDSRPGRTPSRRRNAG